MVNIVNLWIGFQWMRVKLHLPDWYKPQLRDGWRLKYEVASVVFSVEEDPDVCIFLLHCIFSCLQICLYAWYWLIWSLPMKHTNTHHISCRLWPLDVAGLSLRWIMANILIGPPLWLPPQFAPMSGMPRKYPKLDGRPGIKLRVAMQQM